MGSTGGLGGAAGGGSPSGSGGASASGGSAGSSTGGSSAADGGASGSATGGSSNGSGGSPGDSTGGSSNGSGGSPADSTGGSSNGSGGAGTGGGTGGPQDAGPPNVDCNLVWSSGFENGFPGEFSSYDPGYFSPNGTLPAGKGAGWTIVDRASGEPVYEGDHAYKGWVEKTYSENHRPYPVIDQTPYETPLVNTYMVYLDVDYNHLGGDWIHFGTWGNWRFQDDSGIWALHTMAVRERHLEFAHVNPGPGEYIGPSPVPEFPLRQWVRFTVYIHYKGSTGDVQVWQDGVPMLRAEVSQLSSAPGTELVTAHWGLYAPPSVDAGAQYNDSIRLWQLDAPLTDLTTEPRCGN